VWQDVVWSLKRLTKLCQIALVVEFWFTWQPWTINFKIIFAPKAWILCNPFLIDLYNVNYTVVAKGDLTNWTVVTNVLKTNNLSEFWCSMLEKYLIPTKWALQCFNPFRVTTCVKHGYEHCWLIKAVPQTYGCRSWHTQCHIPAMCILKFSYERRKKPSYTFLAYILLPCDLRECLQRKRISYWLLGICSRPCLSLQNMYMSIFFKLMPYTVMYVHSGEYNCGATWKKK
jgi:hypothetical protein